MMHWGNVTGMGYGGFGFGWIFMVLFLALVILSTFYLLKQLVSSKESVAKESAQDILKKRYAAGEITKGEYNDRLSVIRGT